MRFFCCWGGLGFDWDTLLSVKGWVLVGIELEIGPIDEPTKGLPSFDDWVGNWFGDKLSTFLVGINGLVEEFSILGVDIKGELWGCGICLDVYVFFVFFFLKTSSSESEEPPNNPFLDLVSFAGTFLAGLMSLSSSSDEPAKSPFLFLIYF